jgi:hypothetical protein
MGRSFDRGGRSRKEREHGKRRAYQQAERDKEARQAVMQAKRMRVAAEASYKRQPVFSAPAPVVAVETARPPALEIPAEAVAEKTPGFLTRLLGRFFKKAA